MAHALRESVRVLKSGGRIVDLRPHFVKAERSLRAGREQVYCVDEAGQIHAATLKRDLDGFWFTDRLIGEMVSVGYLRKEAGIVFPFNAYFHDLEAFDRFKSIRWDNASMTATDRRNLVRTLRRNPGMRIRIDSPMQLNVYEVP
jgi:hypothetical protein